VDPAVLTTVYAGNDENSPRTLPQPEVRQRCFLAGMGNPDVIGLQASYRALHQYGTP
jgi:hypothetical protein